MGSHSKLSGSPKMTTSFYLSSSSHKKESIKASLYENFILIKFKVQHIWLRIKIRIASSKSHSILILFLNSKELNHKRRIHWEDQFLSNSKGLEALFSFKMTKIKKYLFYGEMLFPQYLIRGVFMNCLNPWRK